MDKKQKASKKMEYLSFLKSVKDTETKKIILLTEIPIETLTKLKGTDQEKIDLFNQQSIDVGRFELVNPNYVAASFIETPRSLPIDSFKKYD